MSGASTVGRKALHTLVRAHQRHRRLVGEEGQPAEHGPSDREAGRVGGPGDAVLLAPGRERAGSVRRQRIDADRRRADGPQGVPHGTRSSVLRCHRRALVELHRQEARKGPPWRVRGCLSTSWSRTARQYEAEGMEDRGARALPRGMGFPDRPAKGINGSTNLSRRTLSPNFST